MNKLFSKNKILLIVTISWVLISCNMVEYTLLESGTRVPKNPDVYKNKIKFDKSLLTVIDTSVVYEEYSTETNMLERLDLSEYSFPRYIVYKFYPNGCFNVYAFDKKRLPTVGELDPNYAGARGIYYKDGDQIRYELFSSIDEVGHFGRIKGTFRISGDTLFEKMDDIKGIDAQTFEPSIYIKRNLPPEYFIYKADW